MKCKHCDGTGKSNMYKDGDFVDCMYCGGTGEMEVIQTEEEWLKSLNTKQLAKWITYQIYYATTCDVYSQNRKNWNVNEWENWLKQPHSEKENHK